MTNTRNRAFSRRMLLIALLSLLFNVVYFISFYALLGRQQGLDIAAALRAAGAKMLATLPALLLGAIIGFFVILFIFTRKAPAASPLAAGRQRWQRLRRAALIMMLPVLLVAAGIMTYHLATGRWQDLDWLLLIIVAGYGALLLIFLRTSPSSEQLQAMETGDTSRINDERAQQVQGKGALTAVNLFFALLLLLGIPYETIVVGRWPLLTLLEATLLLTLLLAATSYWNRRL